MRGIKSVISISKIKKINLIIKKWVLNGKRFLEIGSNPHSNGDVFSRSWKDFFEMIRLISMSKVAIINGIKVIMINWKIIYIKIFKFFNWKLNVIIILYK